MTIQQIRQIIAEFRKVKTPESVSPSSLGLILAEIVNAAENSDTQTMSLVNCRKFSNTKTFDVVEPDGSAIQYRMLNNAGNTVMEIDSNGFPSYYHPQTGQKIISVVRNGSYPGWWQLNYATTGNSFLISCDTVAQFQYSNGMLAMGICNTEAEAAKYGTKLGLSRAYRRDGVEQYFDNVNGAAGLPQYQMWNFAGDKVLEIDKDGFPSYYHPQTGQKIISVVRNGSYPGWWQLNYATTGNSFLISCDTVAQFQYSNGMLAMGICNTEAEAAKYGTKLGLSRAYRRDGVEQYFDNVNGAAGLPQYQMWNFAGDKVLEIDKDGVLDIPGYLRDSDMKPLKGKKIVFIGDSLMTGYPKNPYNSDAKTDTARAEAYPYMLARLTGAEVEVIALPGATARTADLDGNPINVDRCFMNSRQKADELNQSDMNAKARAMAFSYEGQFTNSIDSADLIVFGLGNNDISIDIVQSDGNHSLRDGSEFRPDSQVSLDTLDTKYYTGAFNSLMKYIYSKRLNARVAMLTHFSYADAQSYPFNCSELQIALQKRIARHWSIPCLCPADLLGWNYNGDNATSRLMKYCPDQIHPTDGQGKEDLCKAIYRQMMQYVITQDNLSKL